MTVVTDPLIEVAYALRVIRAEFDEMPGMRLTLSQASRLWRLPEGACAAVLDDLVGAGFLARDASRRYMRRAAAR